MNKQQKNHALGMRIVIRNAEWVIRRGDSSADAGHQLAQLYIESMLRQRLQTDQQLHLGDKAAMDPFPFQLDPTLMSLVQPRQLIPIADSVGQGKTLEAEIMMSELIRRGKGKRILVLATKSMLTQFQKEMWSSFTLSPAGPVKRNIEYLAPFDKCDREQDYNTVWAELDRRFNAS